MNETAKISEQGSTPKIHSPEQAGIRQDPLLIGVSKIHHAFNGNEVLSGVSFTVRPGEFLSLLGPSGSGKTTLLRVIAGLVRPDSGHVAFAGKNVSNLSADQRDTGYVFQNYALFPHLSVYENIAFPLRIRRIPPTDIKSRIAEMVERMRLDGLTSRRPFELSGGQQQRVALARALVFHPRVLLMDEPLGSLDKNLRQRLQLELRQLQRTIGITTIYVTHDQDEAFSLSDKIAVMGRGQIQQLASPEDIYHRPQNLFVAEFVGDLNRLSGVVAGHLEGRTLVKTDEDVVVEVIADDKPRIGSHVVIGIRPHNLRLNAAAPTALGGLNAKIGSIIFKGTHYWVEMVLSSTKKLSAIVPSAKGLSEGAEAAVHWSPGDWLLFNS